MITVGSPNVCFSAITSGWVQHEFYWNNIVTIWTLLSKPRASHLRVDILHVVAPSCCVQWSSEALWCSLRLPPITHFPLLPTAHWLLNWLHPPTWIVEQSPSCFTTRCRIQTAYKTTVVWPCGVFTADACKVQLPSESELFSPPK